MPCGPLAERLLRTGAARMGNEELLALCLLEDDEAAALSSARRLLDEHGLPAFEANAMGIDRPLTPNLYARLAAGQELQRRASEALHAGASERIDGARDIAAMFRFIAERREESFYVLILAPDRRIVFYEKAFDGDKSRVYVDARKIVGLALKYDSHLIAFVHNHPDDDPRPSTNDIKAMYGLYAVCAGVNVQVLDSVIVAKSGYYSFAKKKVAPYR